MCLCVCVCVCVVLFVAWANVCLFDLFALFVWVAFVCMRLFAFVCLCVCVFVLFVCASYSVESIMSSYLLFCFLGMVIDDL